MTWTNTRIYLFFIYGLTIFFGREYAFALFRGLDIEPHRYSQALSSDAGWVCGDTVLITLDQHCSAPVLPKDVLLGSGNDHESQYVKILYPFEGYDINRVSQCGTFRYVVFATKGAADWTPDGYFPDEQIDTEICWGYVQGEDKTPPEGCIRTVVGLHRSPANYPAEPDYFQSTQAPKEIDGHTFTYRPVSTEAANCRDQILGPEALLDPHTALLICNRYRLHFPTTPVLARLHLCLLHGFSGIKRTTAAHGRHKSSGSLIACWITGAGRPR